MSGLAIERLADGHTWLRVADPGWADPLDASFAARHGGRWNPPESFPTLYLNEDLATARANLAGFIASWPYEPEDLREDAAPVLVRATLPRAQEVAEVVTLEGLQAAGLPVSYPLDEEGSVVGHERCQPVGAQAKAAGLRGVRCRSARTLDGTGRELAWFPATARSRARLVETVAFSSWFWPPAAPQG